MSDLTENIPVDPVPELVPEPETKRKPRGPSKVTVHNRTTRSITTFDAKGAMLFLGPKHSVPLAANLVGDEINRLVRAGQLRLL